jgi:potassium efflux system protein
MSNIETVMTIFLKIFYYVAFRTAVQIQLLVLVAVLLVAWFSSKRVSEWVQRVFPAKSQQEDTELKPIEQEYRGPAGLQIDISDNGEAAPSRIRKLAWQVGHSIRILLPELTFPSVALLLLLPARLLLNTQTQFVGIIDQIVILLALFWGYRLIAGLLNLLLPAEYASRYHYQLLAPVFWLFVAYQVVSWVIDPRVLSQVVVFDLFNNPVTWGNLFLATVGFYLWLQFARLLQDLLYYLITTQWVSVVPGTANASLTLMRYILIIIGLFFVFNELQFNPTTVAAIATGVTAGIAFGSREILNNFIGGILLLFEQSIRPGDTIEIDGIMGVVTSVNIRATTVQAYDGRELIVPNASVLTSSVVTHTKSSRYARIKIDVGVSYDADLKEVLGILRSIPLEHENVIDDPAPNAFLINFGDSSVNFSLFAWVADLSEKFETTHELYFMIWDAFQSAGIEIPYPQQDLHIRTPSGSLQDII